MEDQAAELPKPDDLSPSERIDFVQKLRRRALKDRASVSDEELRHAIDLLRLDRSVGGGSKSAPKQVVRPTSLADF